ncbi:LysR family transcriptional regulator [Xylocopilactobacillus apis]|nr:LysR family transcriptional regulator [Xylocopilactobacillus apis]
MKSNNDNALLVRSISYFVALAHNLSYTETAVQLGISQPALTQQIKRLEEIVGTPLFSLEGKKIHLTDSGEIFLRAAQKVNGVFAEANDEIKLIREHSHDVINIGVISAMPANVLVDFIVKFRKNHPSVDFNIKSILRHSLRFQLESDSTDILVLYLPDNSFAGLSKYRTNRISKSEMLLVSPFKINNGNKVTLDEIHDYNWVGYPKGYYMDQIITEQCHDSNIFVPRYSARFSQVENILTYGKKTKSIAAIPDTCLPFVKDGSYIYEFNPVIKFDVAIVYRTSKLKVPIINKCLNEFDLYLHQKDYLTRLKELVREDT